MSFTTKGTKYCPPHTYDSEDQFIDIQINWALRCWLRNVGEKCYLRSIVRNTVRITKSNYGYYLSLAETEQAILAKVNESSNIRLIKGKILVNVGMKKEVARVNLLNRILKVIK